MEMYHDTKKFYICFDGGMDYQLDGNVGYDTEEEAQRVVDEIEALHEKVLGCKMGGFYIS